MIHECDLNLDGSINFQEFIYLMLNKQSLSETESDYYEAFKFFDKDGNG